MAFTDPQRSDIRYRMGWPSRYYDENNQLEMAMDVVGADADASTTILGLLASCATIDTALVDALKRIKVLKAGTAELPGFGEIAALRSEGRRYIGRISAILDVQPQADVYSGAGPRFSNRLMFG